MFPCSTALLAAYHGHQPTHLGADSEAEGMTNCDVSWMEMDSVFVQLTYSSKLVDQLINTSLFCLDYFAIKPEKRKALEQKKTLQHCLKNSA